MDRVLRLLAGVFVLVASGAASAISGVCPDGSIFIVQDPKAIPCRGAKQVEPDRVPPLNPEFLPRPYGWDVFNREQDPNNPYNLVDVDRPGLAPEASTPPAPPRTAPAPAPAPTVAPPPAPALTPSGVGALALAREEVDQLVTIVEVLQDRAPASFVQRDADQAQALQVRFARSAAFEARLGDALARRGLAPAGPAVVFHVEARSPASFWGNLTFVQGHVAFSPDSSDPSQFGLVEGELGALRAGGRLVGYAVLPAGADTRQPLDVYWNDRRLTAVLSP